MALRANPQISHLTIKLNEASMVTIILNPLIAINDLYVEQIWLIRKQIEQSLMLSETLSIEINPKVIRRFEDFLGMKEVSLVSATTK